jgi:replicative DNA helicase
MKNNNSYDPHSLEAEQALLGAIFLDNTLMDNLIGIVHPKSFYNERHGDIFKSMLELYNLKVPIDEITVGDQLESFGKLESIGSYAYLAEIVDCAPVSGNMIYYAKIIREHALCRDLITITSEIGRKGRDPQQDVTKLLIEAETKIREIALSNADEGFVHIKEIVKENLEELEELSRNQETVIGIKTPFVQLNALTSGLLPADLIIIAARPGMGKTVMALNIASYAGKMDCKPGAVAFVSREMQNTKLSKRTISSEGEINTHFMKTGKAKDQETWDRLGKAVDNLSVSNIYFNEKAKHIDQIVNQIKSLDKRLTDGVKLVVVDYLQRIRTDRKQTRAEEMGDITGKLKDLAKDLNIPVILLSQLNRGLETRSDKRPELSDLKDSGSIEEDADLIIFIYRDDYYNHKSADRGIAEISIKKHRDGPTGLIKLIWKPQFSKFCNPEKYENQSFNNQDEF